jgi:DNA-binding LacI/PurR family transcriptional regulator
MVDIAKRAGVAVSTVSYALSGKRSVSAATRGRIQEAITELGFQPHALARALKSRSSRTIALFYPGTRDAIEIDRDIFLAGVAEGTSEADYSLLVSMAAHDPLAIATMLETGRADGVVLMEVRMHDQRVARLQADRHPFSLIGRCENNDGISFVDFDFEGAVRTAMAHLHELGHRHVVLLNHHGSAPAVVGPDFGPAVRARLGFEEALTDLSMEGEVLRSGLAADHEIEALRYLERTPSCTAAITVSLTFTPLLAALRDLNRRVPQDFSVVAIVAPQVAMLVRPPLTTIDVPAFEMGRLGAEILIRRLADGDAPPSQHILRGQLQVRSSGPPPTLRPRAAADVRNVVNG